MNAVQKGFTLIELVIVIVILGILAAVAVPKFNSMSGEAGDAAAQGVAGALSSAAAMNLAKYQVAGGTSTGAIAITAATKCSDLSGLLAGGQLPTNVNFVAPTTTITCGTPAQGSVDATSCMVNHTNGSTSAGFPVKVMCTG